MINLIPKLARDLMGGRRGSVAAEQPFGQALQRGRITLLDNTSSNGKLFAQVLLAKIGAAALYYGGLAIGISGLALVGASISLPATLVIAGSWKV